MNIFVLEARFDLNGIQSRIGDWNSIQIKSCRRMTTPDDHCMCSAAEARVVRANIAPNRSKNRAISDRNRRSFAPKMCANNRKILSKLFLCLISSATRPKTLPLAWRTRSAPAARKKSAKPNENACDFREKFSQFFLR